MIFLGVLSLVNRLSLFFFFSFFSNTRRHSNEIRVRCPYLLALQKKHLRLKGDYKLQGRG